MELESKISVTLDKTLIENLLNGLYGGAKAKNLKVVIDVDGVFHIDSKELRIAVTFDDKGTGIKHIHVHNEKLCTEVSASDIEKNGFTRFSMDIVRELREKYSPAHHGLADNIYVFYRTYNG